MVKQKPVNSTWTDGQWDAIASRNTSILVSAGAGSGKSLLYREYVYQQFQFSGKTERKHPDGRRTHRRCVSGRGCGASGNDDGMPSGSRIDRISDQCGTGTVL